MQVTQAVFGHLSSILGIYSLLLVARIVLTWFAGHRRSGLARFLSRATDPYIDWWRRRFNLRVGFMDLSPMVGIAAIAVLRNVFSAIAVQGSISLGIVAAILVAAVWAIVSALLWLCVIVLVLRLIGFFMNRDMYGTFWQVVDSIARPIMFRVTGILFRNRPVNFVTGAVVSVAAFVALLLIGGWLRDLLFALLTAPSPSPPP